MNGRRVFLDTHGWLGLLNASDSLHSAATELWQELAHQASSIVLTDWIVAETGNGLARTVAREQFAKAVRLLWESPKVEVVRVSESLCHRALELYGERSDKTWGLVDCASFLVMKDAGLNEAFTNDRHFRQAGFRTLLPGG
jgi:predicted nucleic acid-binding protein